jgi:hypothetical protein
MRKLISFQDKHELCRYLVQSGLLEYLDVQEEKQLRTGLSINIIFPGKIYQVIDMANILLEYHVREELQTCLIKQVSAKNGTCGPHRTCSCEEAPVYYGPV